MLYPLRHPLTASVRDHRYLLFTMFSDVVKRKVRIGSINDVVVAGRAYTLEVA